MGRRTPARIDEASFHRLASLVRSAAGIELGGKDRDLTQARLLPRLAELGLTSFREYLDRVEADPTGAELRVALDALSTNLTRFMREAEHFERMTNELAPRLCGTGPNRQRSLRVWSAACSTGQEPYSIAMSLAERLPNLAGRDIRILATDLCQDALTEARRGIYERSVLEPLGATRIARFFRPAASARPGEYEVELGLRRLVTFARLNLVDRWPMRRGFDAIFCRNVLIYFSAATCRRLATRFARQLKPGGFLFVGHSETLDGQEPLLEKVGPATYRKRAAAHSEDERNAA